MFDIEAYNKQKATRAKLMPLHRFSLQHVETLMTGDQIDENLQIQHIKSIIAERFSGDKG